MEIQPGEPRGTEYWERVEEIFAAALAAEVSARTTVLDAQCEGRADLRAEVDALLAAHDRAGDFITAPAVGDGLPREIYEPGTRVGAFRLARRIAKGGMGEVWRADRVEGDRAEPRDEDLHAIEKAQDAVSPRFSPWQTLDYSVVYTYHVRGERDIAA